MDDHLTKEGLIEHLEGLAKKYWNVALTTETHGEREACAEAWGKHEAYRSLACLLSHEDIVFVPRTLWEEKNG